MRFEAHLKNEPHGAVHISPGGSVLTCPCNVDQATCEHSNHFQKGFFHQGRDSNSLFLSSRAFWASSEAFKRARKVLNLLEGFTLSKPGFFGLLEYHTSLLFRLLKFINYLIKAALQSGLQSVEKPDCSSSCNWVSRQTEKTSAAGLFRQTECGTRGPTFFHRQYSQSPLNHAGKRFLLFFAQRVTMLSVDTPKMDVSPLLLPTGTQIKYSHVHRKTPLNVSPATQNLSILRVSWENTVFTVTEYQRILGLSSFYRNFVAVIRKKQELLCMWST